MSLNTQPSLSKIVDGIVCFDEQKVFLNSTDYPYFRDDPGNWADRLEKLKSLGHSVISCYIPWRHHDIELEHGRRYDFKGETYPNRDLIGFLMLCHEKGFKVIAKPGPFIHAELNYGGLPNWVCPSFNPSIEPMLGGDGKPFVWGGVEKKVDGSGLQELPLPSPFDPLFLQEAERWLKTVTDVVIKPLMYPNGPIVMIQVGNEGIFSNYQRAPWAYDYSNSSLELYSRFLKEIYGDLEAYNELHGTNWDDWEQIEPPRKWHCPSNLHGFRFYADWAAYQSYYMREILTHLRCCIPVDLPFIINANPPTKEPFGMDAWLSRINPDDLPGIHYGFTNWIGVACKDPSVVERYQLLIKRARGTNQEENWGFSELYEPEFQYPSVCFYQTLIQVASGATGYNVYTGAGTSHVHPDLDRMQQEVYPDCPPIDGNGCWTPKADAVRILNEFFNRWGNEFLETKPVRPIVFGLYLPYAHSSVWVAEHDWEAVRSLGVPNHGQVLQQFQQVCLKNHLDFDLINLQMAADSQLQGYPTLVLASGCWMDRVTQQKLARYAQGGGRLVLVGEVPCLDENFQPVDILSKVCQESQLFCATDFDRWISHQKDKAEEFYLPIQAANRAGEQARIWLYRHLVKKVDYLFVFSGAESNQPIEFQIKDLSVVHSVGITLPRMSAAVMRIENGAITDMLAKGRNEELGEEVTVACLFNGEQISASKKGDWIYTRS